MDGLVATLQSLVRLAGGPPEKTLAWCRARAEASGFAATMLPNGAMYAARVVPGARPLALSGHVDVVPAGSGWEIPAFEGRVADGAVHGRGAADMLGSVACFLELAERRRDLPVALALTTDEETRMAGAEAIVAAGVLDAAAGVVVGEPTAFDVGVAEKGVLWARMTATGRGAHGSMPERGENAAEKIVRAWSRVAALPLAGEDALLGRPTRSLGTLAAGTSVNVVPDRAAAEIDFRFLPSMTADRLLADVRAAAAPDATVEAVSVHPPFAARDGSRLAAAALAAARAERATARAVGLPYGTEASRYAPVADCVILGPGDPAVIHTPRERIALADLEAGYRAYERLVEEVTRGTRGPRR